MVVGSFYFYFQLMRWVAVSGVLPRAYSGSLKARLIKTRIGDWPQMPIFKTRNPTPPRSRSRPSAPAALQEMKGAESVMGRIKYR
jgi:hypothetical protein